MSGQVCDPNVPDRCEVSGQVCDPNVPDRYEVSGQVCVVYVPGRCGSGKHQGRCVPCIYLEGVVKEGIRAGV